MELDKIYNMDCFEGMKLIEDNSIDCCITSPPYYALRDYGVDGQIGLENSPDEYIDKLTNLFSEVLRVLKPTGTCWLVIGDTYNCYRCTANRTNFDNEWVGLSNHPARPSGYGLDSKNIKDKDLIGIPWMLAFALRRIGFYLRQDIIWHKPNPMPESVKSRCTKSHEYIFMFSKSARYFFDEEALREPANTGFRKNEYYHRAVKFVVPGQKNVQFRGSNQSDGFRNKRDVWSILVKPGYDGHHATFPLEIPAQCMSLGCPSGGIVLDPFMGSGTTAIACHRTKRHFIGFELNKEYYDKACKRIKTEQAQLTLF